MAFGSDFDNSDEVMSEINMTPLVDVMLVLLIIFIIAIPVLTNAVKLDLPRAAATPDEVKPERVTLSITPDGIVHWNDVPLGDLELEARLRAVAEQQPQPEIAVRGDRKTEYEYVIRVMATAQRAGIQKLGFVTEPAGN
ncbi:MAG: biopolymer transporter ExbD [Gammaproteobacteria bacterium]|nr:biopolymer transporter ExbD [Gammaproteobacteria bacterium]